jgi:hypothetical protein
MSCTIVSLGTFLEYTGDGGTTDFLAPTFNPDVSELCVRVQGDDQIEGVDYTFNPGPNLVQFLSAPPNDSFIEILRNTPVASKLVDFVDGSINREEDMDLAVDQLFFKIQELFDQLNFGTLNFLGQTNGNWDAKGRRIINVGFPVDANDAVTKAYVDALAGLAPGVGFVTSGRQILTTEGVTGGGDLSADRTIRLDLNNLVEDSGFDPAVDFMLWYDVVLGTHRKIKFEDLPSTPAQTFEDLFDSVTESTDLDFNNDFIVFLDVSADEAFDIKPVDFIRQMFADLGGLANVDPTADSVLGYDASALTPKLIKIQDLHACTAWANFQGNPVALNDNFNVSSITDNGVGDYTVNFTNPLVETSDYAFSAAGQINPPPTELHVAFQSIPAGSSRFVFTDGAVAVDPTEVSFLAVGPRL